VKCTLLIVPLLCAVFIQCSRAIINIHSGVEIPVDAIFKGCQKYASKTTVIWTKQTMKLKVVGLFSGIGGIEYGLRSSGHDIILLCEKDAGARQVLQRHFPGVRISNDVAELKDLPKETTAVAAGFPCLDVSKAGKRAGFEGISYSTLSALSTLSDTKRALNIFFR
jgi:C-5 cytosine-specific DNA methylase